MKSSASGPTVLPHAAASAPVDRAKQLGNAPIGRLLVRFSVPAIIGMVVQALYNMVDRIFIGNGVGPLGLAGATVSFPFMLIFMAFGMLIGIGGNSLVSIALGEGRKDYAERVMGNALVLMIVVMVILTGVGLAFLEPLLRLTGASDAILPFGRAYLQVILFGTVFNGIGFGFNNFIRGEGNPKMAMGTMLLGAILNTILDPIFIFVFDMGIAGAAWATIISQTATAVWVMRYFLFGPSLLKFRLRNLRLDRAVVTRIVAIGSAPFAMQFVASILNTLLNGQLQRYGGDVAIAVIGALYSFSMLVLMPVFGINQGSQPIIGFNYGAKQYRRVVRTAELAILAATGIVLVGWLATRLFPGAIIGMFGSGDPEFSDLGRRAVGIFFLMLPFIGFQIVASNYFQAIGKPMQAMLLGLSRQVIFLVPLLFLLPLRWGLEGVYAAIPVADVLSALVTAVFFLSALRRMHAAGSDPQTTSGTDTMSDTDTRLGSAATPGAGQSGVGVKSEASPPIRPRPAG